MRTQGFALGIAAGFCAGPMTHMGSLSAQAPRSTADSLYGTVIDSVSHVPLANALVLLLRESDRHMPWDSSRARALTDTSGRFSIPDLPHGHYQMYVNWIGYRKRVIAVSHPIPDGGGLVVGLRSLGMCFDEPCLPDSAYVAEARSRRQEWTCYTEDAGAIEAIRTGWVEILSRRTPLFLDSLLLRAHVPRDSARVASILHHVTDPAVCRRAGATYDSAVGAADIQFLVYRMGPIFVVSQRHGAARELVLDQAYGLVWRFNGAELRK